MRTSTPSRAGEPAPGAPPHVPPPAPHSAAGALASSARFSPRALLPGHAAESPGAGAGAGAERSYAGWWRNGVPRGHGAHRQQPSAAPAPPARPPGGARSPRRLPKVARAAGRGARTVDGSASILQSQMIVWTQAAGGGTLVPPLPPLLPPCATHARRRVRRAGPGARRSAPWGVQCAMFLLGSPQARSSSYLVRSEGRGVSN